MAQYAGFLYRDHPFKTSALLRGGGVKYLPNLPMDSTKKLHIEPFNTVSKSVCFGFTYSSRY